MSARNLVPTFLTLVSLAPASSLLASDASICGTGYGKLNAGHLGLSARASDFPAGSAYRDALVDVVDAWSNTRSKVNIEVGFNATDPGPENYASEVYFVDNLYPQAMAMVWKAPPTCTIVEADVLILDSYDWTASTDPGDIYAYGGPDHPLRTVLFHELGHAQGLGHTSNVFSVMGQDENCLHVNDGIATAYPGEDAVSKSVALYGQVNGTYEDLGLAHWKYNGPSGQYSTHTRTSVLSWNGSSVVKIDFPDSQFEVGIGEQVKVETTVENFGKGSHNVRIGYYLSSNDHLSTQDRYLGSHVKYVTPNTPATIVSPALTIPLDLQSETNYWIGAIIDDNQQLVEADEWNNRTSIRIRTRSLPVDLSAAGVSGPASKKAGNMAGVSSTTVNLGDEGPGAFTYEIRLSANTTITTSDLLLGSFQSTDLGFHYDQVMIPANLTPGDYYFGLRIIPEAGEVVTNNNVLVGNKVTITKGNPDLVALGVTGPMVTQVNDHVAIQYTIGNVGGSSNGPFKYKVYLSLDSTISATDYLVKSGTTYSLGQKTVNVTIPALPQTGFYRLGLILDPMPGETILGNNVIPGGTVHIDSIDGTPGDVTGG